MRTNMIHDLPERVWIKALDNVQLIRPELRCPNCNGSGQVLAIILHNFNKILVEDFCQCVTSQQTDSTIAIRLDLTDYNEFCGNNGY